MSNAGRKPVAESDRIALDEIMISKEKREALVKELKRFSIELEQQKSRAKNLNEDIKAVAKETFGLSTKKFKELVSVVDSGDFDGVINTLTSTVDMLEVIKEQGVNMLLKEYLEALNELVKKDKSLLECRVIFSRDDEGNGYQVVSSTAEVFYVDRDDSKYYIEQIYDEVEASEYEINAEKVVIIN